MVSDATRNQRKRRESLAVLARRMRREPTEAEARFWHYARNRGIGGLKFRRQVALGAFIADYLCAEENIIVEIDGGQHAEDGRDTARDAYLTAQGYRILRFWNHDVLSDMSAVAETILAARLVPPHPTLSPDGGEE